MNYADPLSELDPVQLHAVRIAMNGGCDPDVEAALAALDRATSTGHYTATDPQTQFHLQIAMEFVRRALDPPGAGASSPESDEPSSPAPDPSPRRELTRDEKVAAKRRRKASRAARRKGRR